RVLLPQGPVGPGPALQGVERSRSRRVALPGPRFPVPGTVFGRDRIVPVGALRLVFVTSRPEKAREAERLGVEIDRLHLDLPEPHALDPSQIVEEKARNAYAILSRPVLVEDSGLAIHAWGGFPGALVKWVEKSAGVPAIARMLDGFSDRSATALCAIGYCDGGEVVTARGETHGSIASEPRGTTGFRSDLL